MPRQLHPYRIITDEEILEIAEGENKGEIPFSLREAMFDDQPVDLRIDLSTCGPRRPLDIDLDW